MVSFIRSLICIPNPLIVKGYIRSRNKGIALYTFIYYTSYKERGRGECVCGAGEGVRNFIVLTIFLKLGYVGD